MNTKIVQKMTTIDVIKIETITAHDFSINIPTAKIPIIIATGIITEA